MKQINLEIGLAKSVQKKMLYGAKERTGVWKKSNKFDTRCENRISEAGNKVFHPHLCPFLICRTKKLERQTFVMWRSEAHTPRKVKTFRHSAYKYLYTKPASHVNQNTYFCFGCVQNTQTKFLLFLKKPVPNLAESI